MDRVFFNSLLILKGVTLAFGAEVLLQLIRRDTPWESWEDFSVYLAWTATIVLVILTLVSQALGSMQSAIHPTTEVVLLTFILAIGEFVTFGLLQPQTDDHLPITIRTWLLGVVTISAAAFIFLIVVLHQLESDHYPHTRAEDAEKKIVRADRMGAAAMTLTALGFWLLFGLTIVRDHITAVAPATIGAVALIALITQQKKINL